MKKLYLLFLLFFFLIIGCSNQEVQQNLTDNSSLYKDESLSTLYNLELTIINSKDNRLAEGNHTFKELNTSNGKENNKDIQVSGILKEVINGKSQPRLLGFGLTNANAVIEQRGQSSRLSDLKSYEITLLKNGGLWQNNEVINLNKHPFDNALIRNKLSFDLFKLNPAVLSLDVNFVNLKIKDLNIKNSKFKDYGLFTQVEEVDENYFKKRNLDPNGELYKAINFEFRQYKDSLLLKSNPNYNKNEFEKIIEIENADDHDKLINLIDKINNPLISINKVLKDNFNRENYLNWLATNILLGNVDSASGNYYLYSPKNSQTWYFIPWDYDKAIGAYTGDKSQWKKGVSNYWGSILHKKFLKNDKNRKELTHTIEKIYYEVYNLENIEKLLKLYNPIIKKTLSKDPDKSFFSSYDEVVKEINTIPYEIRENRDKYYESLEAPMPFFLGSVVDIGQYISFNWDEAYDFQKQNIKYNLSISKTPDMNSIIYEKKGIDDTELILDSLPQGNYYWKVIAYDSDMNSQEAFDFYIDRDTNFYYFGIKNFYVE